MNITNEGNVNVMYENNINVTYEDSHQNDVLDVNIKTDLAK